MFQSGPTSRLSRRDFLGLGVATTTFLPGLLRAEGPDGRSDVERGEVEKIRERARKVGLGEIHETSGDHFLVIGDASSAFQKEVLEFCEKLGEDFLEYYSRRGFPVAYPERNMTVVVLKNRESYEKWIDDEADEAVGGHYDLNSNRLVVFDFRGDAEGLGKQARVVNSFTLSHETNHLLCFNTGLLDRDADVPTCISEGLATYGELFQKSGRSSIGSVNRPRLGALTVAARRGEPWISLNALIGRDELFQAPETAQVAYAESWLVISMLIKKPEKLPKFQAYLKRLRKTVSSADRIQAFESTIGSLDTIDRQLKAAARPYLR